MSVSLVQVCPVESCTSLSGIYTLTDRVRTGAIQFTEDVVCLHKVDMLYSFHLGGPSKVYYRLCDLIKRGDVRLTKLPLPSWAHRQVSMIL